MESSFVDRFKSIADLLSWSTSPGPREAVGQERGFVGECAEGYSLGFFDYSHDILVRSLLQVAIEDFQIRESLDFQSFREEVESVDADFLAILDLRHRVAVEPVKWWLEFIPRSGSQDLAQDILELFGWRIEVD